MLYFSEIIQQSPQMPERSEAEKKNEYRLFFENFDLILKNVALVNRDRRLFCTRLGFIHVSGMYIGSRYIHLGILLKLWNTGTLREQCPHCGSSGYIYSAGGSPLSGMNSYSAYCSECRKHFHGSRDSFGSIYSPVFKTLKQNPLFITKEILMTPEAKKASEERMSPTLASSLKAMNTIRREKEDEEVFEIILDDTANGYDFETVIKILKENGK